MDEQFEDILSIIELLQNSIIVLKENIDTEKCKNTDSDQTLTPAQITELTLVINSKVVSLLNGKSSPLYENKSIRAKCFSNIYNRIHLEFGIKRLNQLKQKHIPMCKSIICNYTLPVILKEEIEEVMQC